MLSQRLSVSLLLILSFSSCVLSDGGKKLKILLVSDALLGHLAPLLALGGELADRGHNVTQFLALHEHQQVKYRTHIEKYGVHLWNVSSEDLIDYDIEELTKQVSKAFYSIMIGKFSQYGAVVMKIMAKHLSKSLSAGDWDLVIGIEYMVVAVSCLSSAHDDIPFVFVGKLSGAFHLYPSWPWPGLVQGALADNMDFKDRMLNYPSNLAMKAFIYSLCYSSMNAVAEYCPSLSLMQALTKVGVHIPAIVPSVIGLEHPRTISPMTDYVGPLIPRSAAPLSEDLGAWLGAKPDRSVVYVSMGSLFDLDEENGRAIVEGVMKSNRSVLWSLKKSNQHILQGLELDPDRVLISDWTPQLSVLGSTAIHSAILHGGFNGLSDALWNAVPIVIVPLMQEQIYNAGRVHFNGLGIHLDAKDMSAAKIAESLRALDTGEYRSKVSRIQKVFRMAGGVKRAADLVEFYADVGYAHLVPAYAKYRWSWVQYYNADVYAVMIATLITALVCLKTCCKCIWKMCSRKQKKD